VAVIREGGINVDLNHTVMVWLSTPRTPRNIFLKKKKKEKGKGKKEKEKISIIHAVELGY
jgi:hypothetical protein